MKHKEIKGQFEALIQFKDIHFEFDDSCIGAEVEFNYKNQGFIICFPNFIPNSNPNSALMTLKGTKLRVGWVNRNDDKNNLGVASTTRADKVTQFRCNQFIIRSKTRLNKKNALKAKRNLEAWKKIFILWFEVLEYRDLEKSNVTIERSESIECVLTPSLKKEKVIRIKERNHVQMSFYITLTTGFNQTILKRVLKFSSTGQYPPDYYIQLIKALKYYYRKQYRQCILDLATAFEIALIHLLDMQLSSIANKKVQGLVENKYNKIINLSIALRKLDENDLPPQNDIDRKICAPRNKAIHKGKEVTISEAREALQFVKEFIYTKFPFI